MSPPARRAQMLASASFFVAGQRSPGTFEHSSTKGGRYLRCRGVLAVETATERCVSKEYVW
jgi:hypothetical protein